MAATSAQASSEEGAALGPAIVWEVITPQLAEEYLGKNASRNRNLLGASIQKFSNDMAAGRWRRIGDAIRFDKEGFLIDGQHRLHSIVKANVEIVLPVLRGLAADDIHVIDTGRARTPANMLQISGYDNTTLRAAALRILLHIKQGPVTTRSITSYTFPEILEAAERHPDLGESCKVMTPIRGIRPSLVVALHYIGGVLLGQRELADSFVHVIAKGIPTYEDDAAHKFREKMIQAKVDQRGRMTEVFTIRAGIHTWNLFARQAPFRSFKIPQEVAIEGLDLDLL